MPFEAKVVPFGFAMRMSHLRADDGQILEKEQSLLQAIHLVSHSATTKSKTLFPLCFVWGLWTQDTLREGSSQPQLGELRPSVSVVEAAASIPDPKLRTAGSVNPIHTRIRSLVPPSRTRESCPRRPRAGVCGSAVPSSTVSQHSLYASFLPTGLWYKRTVFMGSISL